jgi:hypothetical protein
MSTNVVLKNQSLEYTFIAYYDEFSKFDVAIDSLGISMNGILSPPTVRLIDENGADRAIFTVCFESGTYCYSWRPPRPEGQKKFPAAIEEEKPINGWKMSFYVDFSLKKITTITDKTILEKLLHPNSYSVEQLMIDFGSTDLSTFALDKSEFPGMEGQTAAEKIANDANIKQFAECLHWYARQKQQAQCSRLCCHSEIARRCPNRFTRGPDTSTNKGSASDNQPSARWTSGEQLN